MKPNLNLESHRLVMFMDAIGHVARITRAWAHAATSVNLTFAATVGCEGSFAVDDVEVRVR